MLALNEYKVLTFDCYGTLIDWEWGILNALQPVLAQHGVEMTNEALLELYAQIEPKIQAGAYKPYKLVLQEVMQALGTQLGFTPQNLDCLSESIAHWQPFPDTVLALQELKKHYKLAILSNIDDDLFQGSARHLKTEFDWVITAEQLQSYKPSILNFEQALNIVGIPKENVLHVAQSLYHDIVPAKQLEIATVWVNRRSGQPGFGATAPAHETPDLEVPDLASFVRLVQTRKQPTS